MGLQGYTLTEWITSVLTRWPVIYACESQYKLYCPQKVGDIGTYKNLVISGSHQRRMPRFKSARKAPSFLFTFPKMSRSPK